MSISAQSPGCLICPAKQPINGPMRVLLYAANQSFERLKTNRNSLKDILHHVAEGTDTESLVVLISLEHSTRRWGGAFYPGDIPRGRLRRLRGPWRKAHPDGIPPGLPETFRLIEVHIGSKSSSYPCRDLNRNGFLVSLPSFDAHLAYIFAHELHHYRKHHFGLHPNEGEKGADRWAAARACDLGFEVALEERKQKRRRSFLRKRRTVRPSSKAAEAHWAIMRALHAGALVQLTRSDNRKIPAGSLLSFVRPMRGSYRVLVKSPDGADLCVPMDWLRPVS